MMTLPKGFEFAKECFFFLYSGLELLAKDDQGEWIVRMLLMMM
jgi:hypothetical protein